mmetsp:Transcript_20874/g.44595  ORF Transcript_20874/g.44595 Transcript_20874/m.44595 type:complete len:95 (-) Transcript_20874:433-717(-)
MLQKITAMDEVLLVDLNDGGPVTSEVLPSIAMVNWLNSRIARDVERREASLPVVEIGLLALRMPAAWHIDGFMLFGATSWLRRRPDILVQLHHG